MKIIKVTYSGDLYYDYWAVVQKDGKLYTARCDSDSEGKAILEAQKDIKQPYILMAVVKVGHTAYNQVKHSDFEYSVASKILEVAAAELNIEYAEESNQTHEPGTWVGEKLEAEDNSIARQEAMLENAVEDGQLPGAMPADL